jgi:16S rRNA (guanine966-N2)-methyltransferase
VLDLFAGTGNIALEFLSRGAEEVISVEQDRTLFAFQQRTARELQLPNWHHVRADAFTYMRGAGAGSGAYDIVFADPPFALENTAQLPALVREAGVLAPDGLLIIEHPKEVNMSADPWFSIAPALQQRALQLLHTPTRTVAFAWHGTCPQTPHRRTHRRLSRKLRPR